jgi:hypothetical protein
MLRPWKTAVGNPLEHSVSLVRLIEEIYIEAIVEHEDTGSEIIPEKALKSSKYESFVQTVSVLEKVDLSLLNMDQIFCFFLNVYQCMYVQKFLKQLNSCDGQLDKEGFFKNLGGLVWNSTGKEFFYNIAGKTFTLDEMKHGVLRGNKKKPSAILRTLSNGDDRVYFPDRVDQRILFLCIDLPEIPEHIECFDSPETVNEKLSTFLAEYFRQKVDIDMINEEITLPKVIETYKSDFGSDEDVLRFIWNWYENYDYDIE